MHVSIALAQPSHFDRMFLSLGHSTLPK